MIETLKQRIRKEAKSGFLTRRQIEQATDGLLKRQFLANIDSDKKRRGIQNRMIVGKKTVIYPAESVCYFLENEYIRRIDK